MREAYEMLKNKIANLKVGTRRYKKTIRVGNHLIKLSSGFTYVVTRKG